MNGHFQKMGISHLCFQGEAASPLNQNKGIWTHVDNTVFENRNF